MPPLSSRLYLFINLYKNYFIYILVSTKPPFVSTHTHAKGTHREKEREQRTNERGRAFAQPTFFLMRKFSARERGCEGVAVEVWPGSRLEREREGRANSLQERESECQAEQCEERVAHKKWRFPTQGNREKIAGRGSRPQPGPACLPALCQCVCV